MKIMFKAGSSGKWLKVNERGYAKESELQEMLGVSPDLIPVNELGGGRKSIKVAIREGGLPGSGSTDLIGVDEDGNITVVETKLAANEEIKRKVIGQILEYAAYLWQKSYEDFDRIFYRKLGGHLVDLMEKTEKENDEWSREEFRNAVEANLKNGTFALFIVVDTINEELRRIIDFLNSKNFTDFELYALELKYFQEHGMEIVLPQLYGVANRPTSRSHLKQQWDEAMFMDHAQEKISDETILQNLCELYRFGAEEIGEPIFGTGTDAGRVVFKLPFPEAKNGSLPLFRLKSNGQIKIGFWGITKELPGGRGERLAGLLLGKLSGLPAIQLWYEQTAKEIGDGRRGQAAKFDFPGKNLDFADVFTDGDSVQRFEGGVREFIKEGISPHRHSHPISHILGA